MVPNIDILEKKTYGILKLRSGSTHSAWSASAAAASTAGLFSLHLQFINIRQSIFDNKYNIF